MNLQALKKLATYYLDFSYFTFLADLMMSLDTRYSFPSLQLRRPCLGDAALLGYSYTQFMLWTR